MTTYSLAALAPEYLQLWYSLTVAPGPEKEVARVVERILGGKSRYQTVETATSVPWYVIAVIHSLEGSLDFSTHLHNGDSLSRRTIHVPRGRPADGHPPFKWEESAADALHIDGLDRITSWPIARICYQLEAFNGWGYRDHHIHSPYLWSYSNHYTKGKYTADGQWNASAVSQQPGCMTLLNGLLLVDPTIRLMPSSAPTVVPNSIQAQQQKLAALGFYKGAIDGVIGRQTRQAVADFQTHSGLSPDGVIGPLTAVAIVEAEVKP